MDPGRAHSELKELVTGDAHYTKRNETSAQRRRKHCALAVVRRSQKIRPAAYRLPGGTGQPKFNQLETQFGEDRCTQFRVIMITDLPTHKKNTHKQTGPITMHCATAIASAQCNKIIQFTSTVKSCLNNQCAR